MGSAVNFEIYDLFVGIYEVLIVVLVGQAILKRKLANVSAIHKKDSKIEFLLEAFHLPYGNFHIDDEFEEYTVLTRTPFSY